MNMTRTFELREVFPVCIRFGGDGPHPLLEYVPLPRLKAQLVAKLHGNPKLSPESSNIVLELIFNNNTDVDQVIDRREVQVCLLDGDGLQIENAISVNTSSGTWTLSGRSTSVDIGLSVLFKKLPPSSKLRLVVGVRNLCAAVEVTTM